MHTDYAPLKLGLERRNSHSCNVLLELRPTPAVRLLIDESPHFCGLRGAAAALVGCVLRSRTVRAHAAPQRQPPASLAHVGWLDIRSSAWDMAGNASAIYGCHHRASSGGCSAGYSRVSGGRRRLWTCRRGSSCMMAWVIPVETGGCATCGKARWRRLGSSWARSRRSCLSLGVPRPPLGPGRADLDPESESREQLASSGNWNLKGNESDTAMRQPGPRAGRRGRLHMPYGGPSPGRRHPRPPAHADRGAIGRIST